MVFSKPIFLFGFLPIVLILYYACPRRLKNTVLLIMSLIFYAWGEPRFVFLMLFTIIVDYIAGRLIAQFSDGGTRHAARTVLILAMVINLGLLCYFKYANFIIENLNVLLKGRIEPLNIALPIGISFYTFQTMSYVIDVYRKEIPVEKNILNFAAYVTLFPQLIAGPIVQYKTIADELSLRRETTELFAEGVWRFSVGLGKKVLLANQIGALWTEISGDPGSLTAGKAWIGALAFTFQIYFDFSGYSDMAIGLGKMFGFHFLENFEHPYVSKSITEFWRRWHISLSTWFREYVYIPLGGNRKGKLRQYRNIAVVWLLTGFWHGASWNFLLWGAYFAVLLIVEKLFLYKWLQKAPAVLAHIYTMFFVCISWLIFYFTDLGEGLTCLKAMFGVGVSSFATPTVVYDLLRYLPLLAVCVLAATPLPKRIFDALKNRFVTMRYAQVLLLAGAFLVITAYLVDSTFSPFLYYRF